jgi:myotubularin-related protein 1/2
MNIVISKICIYFQSGNEPPFTYLSDEKMQDPKTDVTYICPYSGALHGKLTISNYRLHFKSQPASEKDPAIAVDVPLGVVSIPD